MNNPAEVLAQQVTERVLDLILAALDVNELLARVDVNALLAQVDVNALLNRVDVDALLDRVDVNALLDRVDVNALVDRADIDALVQGTDLGAVLARSSGGVASDMLDAARSQAVRLDLFVDRLVSRVLRREQAGPAAPPGLVPAPGTP